MQAKISGYDPRKAIFDNIPIDQWDCSKWKQWKPKHTGSPTDYIARLEREYLRIKYAVQQSNQQLTLDKVKIKLKLTSPNAIGLQGTFPCKPGDVGKNGSPNKQYILSLGYGANDNGIKLAIAKARDLDIQLSAKAFNWTTDLLGKEAQKIAQEETQPEKLIRDLIEEFEKEYWKTRSKNRQTSRTLGICLDHLKKLPYDKPLSAQLLIQAMETTKPQSRYRQNLLWQLKRFCKFCGFDAINLLDSYSCKVIKASKRYLPTDELIVNQFDLIGKPLSPHASGKKIYTPEQWQWVYGMLATYGLRPHEIFAIDLEAYVSLSNKEHLLYLKPDLTEGTKTGERKCGIPPLQYEWVELFDLKNVKPIISNAQFRCRTDLINRKFRNINIGFEPYDLRHSYAVRGHRLILPIKAMADFMGHSVEEHTQTYQKWMDKDVNIEIYKEIVIDKQVSTKNELKTENSRLKSENLELKAENERLKMLLTEYKLDDLLNR